MDDLKELDLEWENFCKKTNIDDEINIINTDSNVSNDMDLFTKNKILSCESLTNTDKIYPPISSAIYISTKTQIAYLNQEIDLKDIFWKVKIIPYHVQKEGIIKKQMKFNSSSQEELNILQEKIKLENCVENHIISKIDNPQGRIKFKDIRKISIGISNKDITSYRRKKRGAFYNCFVVIMRLNIDNTFKEIHIKVFNTGKLEIPGIQNDTILYKALDLLVYCLTPMINSNLPLCYNKDATETVLINSNFRCGYFIDRDKLYKILRFKYRINCAFDPCSYPGIQCDFYYDKTLEVQSGQQPFLALKEEGYDANNIVKVSFMVFRTGSILIVGKCTEDILHKIYEFLKKLLIDEFNQISGSTTQKVIEQTKKKKKLKKFILTN
tara:strand:- start:15255 stop:16400 length:1146 start_codon:yes stop_codon:yes gene_type:complete